MPRTEDRISEPPEFSVPLLKKENLPPPEDTVHWENVELPVDFVLVTVKDCEFLACLSLLNDDFYRSFHTTLGMVYFGDIVGKKTKQKVAVIICSKGSSGPEGSAIVVPKVVKILRPKAVFNVGFCGGLNKMKVKLGDVVVSSKLITYAPTKVTEDGVEERGHVVPLNSLLAKVAKNMGDGWKAPSGKLEVAIHNDGVLLSGPEVVDSEERSQQLLQRFPRAIAIEMEGEGLYAAAHDLNVEWIVIKGVSDFADGTKSNTKSWQEFASVMAASLTAHILRIPFVFDDWPHYEDPSAQRSKPSSRSEDLKETSVVHREEAASCLGSENPPSTCSVSPSRKKPKAQDAVKEGSPTREELEKLARRIANKWNPLGRRLNFDEAELIGFHKDVDEYNEKAYKMLLSWKQREGSGATYKILYEALCDESVQRKDLAQTYCCER